jgi:hypothetical protein
LKEGRTEPFGPPDSQNNRWAHISMSTPELESGRSPGIPHCAAHLPLGCPVAGLQLPLGRPYLWLWKRSQRLAASVLEVEHTLALQGAQHPINVHALHCLHLVVGDGENAPSGKLCARQNI